MFLHTQGSDILGIKSLVKFVVSRLALFIVNKNQNFPFFRTYYQQGLRGTSQGERGRERDREREIGGELERERER